MHVHILSNSVVKLSRLRGLLGEACDVTTELLNSTKFNGPRYDAVIAAIDLRQPETIVALKEISQDLARVPKRIFLVDHPSRLTTMQSYALGATAVVSPPINRASLLAEVLDQPAVAAHAAEGRERLRIASVAADYVASMFRASMRGVPIDVNEAADVGNAIAERVAEDGLSAWLDTVRYHHEGTYQHCLLVTGIAVDFGLSLGLRPKDMARLGLAAMLHDIGKAEIPLAILDKPARLSEEERKLIEAHPVAGYEMLKSNPDISDDVLDAVRHHHEYLDGSGYPDGLCGESISDLTRILTISDIFAALIERRSYKPTMSRKKAYDILKSMPDRLEMALVSAFRDVALSR